MKNKSIVWIIGVVVVIIGLFAWSKALQNSDPDVIARNGLHWHPEISIMAKDVKQEIPSGIGLGSVEMPIHTHENTGVIHLEFSGVVRKNDLHLGNFFKIWGKDMRSFGANLKMTVNGKENTEYENYIMRDKDKIELRFE